MRGQISRHRVDALGQILPGARDAHHVGLTAEPSFGADFARHARHFAGEAVELINHRVDGLLQLQNFAGDIDGDLLRKIAAGDGGRDLGDVADLRREVARHRVDAVGQILPGAGDAGHLSLTSELALRADLARDARHFAGEGVELINHGVDRVFQLKDLAAHVDGDLARQVAARHGGRDLCDIAHLIGQVAAHRVDAVGQILPRSRHAGHQRLAAELAFGSHLAGDARHLGGEGPQLVDHRVDGFLELQDLAAHVDGDLLRKVAVGDRDGDFGDVAHLPGQVARHRVDAFDEVLPNPGDLAHLRLTAQLPVRADFAGDARHFRGEHAQLLDHRVDDLRRAKELSLQSDGRRRRAARF